MRTTLALLTLVASGCTSLYPFEFDASTARDAGVVDAGPRDAGAIDAGATDGGPDAGSPDAGVEPCVEPPAECTQIPPSHSAPSEPPCQNGLYRGRDGECAPRMEPAIGNVCFAYPAMPRIVIDCNDSTASERWDALVAAVGALGPSGGILELGPCEFEQANGVGARLEHEGGPLVIEGAGPDRTVVRSVCGGCVYPALAVTGGPVALRDLRFEASGGDRHAIDIQSATDVLLERVHSEGNRSGARLSRLSNLAVRDCELTGQTAGSLVITSANEGFYSFTGTRFTAQRSSGSAALDIRGARNLEVAGCQFADAIMWIRGRSLDRAWIHHSTITNAGTGQIAECDSAPVCIGITMGDLVIHDVTMEPGPSGFVRVNAPAGRVFLFRNVGPEIRAEVPGGRADVYTCEDADTMVSDPDRQRTFDCGPFDRCTTRVFETPPP